MATADIAGPLDLVFSPGLSVVSLQQARKQCRYADDSTQEDDLLRGWLATAQQLCEHEISGHRQIGPATYDLPVCSWWDGELQIPRPPLQAVSVLYYDADDVQQTLATSVYTVRKPWRQQGTIALAPDQEWPTVNTERDWPITIRFVAGYLAPVTADATTDVLTSTGRAFTNGQRVRAYSVGGDLPAPLLATRDYWIVSASGQTLKLSLTAGGSAIDLTDAGTGLHYIGDVPGPLQQAILMLVAHWDQRRESVLTGVMSKEVEFSVSSLLQLEGWGSYR